jgi:hypothetical protein
VRREAQIRRGLKDVRGWAGCGETVNEGVHTGVKRIVVAVKEARKLVFVSRTDSRIIFPS